MWGGKGGILAQGDINSCTVYIVFLSLNRIIISASRYSRLLESYGRICEYKGKHYTLIHVNWIYSSNILPSMNILELLCDLKRNEDPITIKNEDF